MPALVLLAPLEWSAVDWLPLETGSGRFQLLGRLGTTLLAIFVSILLLRLVPRLERVVLAWNTPREDSPPRHQADRERRQRAETLTRVIGSIVRALIWTVATVFILGNLGINVGPLLAGAGLAGLAVGFGAQSIVKDFFAGFFILLEDQFHVGDTVQIGLIVGSVERMTMRVTVLRDGAGVLHFIPNSAITMVSNRSAGRAKSTVDVVVATGVADVEIEEALAEAARLATAAVGEDRLDGSAAVEGPVEIGLGGITWRVAATSDFDDANDVRRALIRAVGQVLRERGLANRGSETTTLVRVQGPGTTAEPAKPS